MNTMTLNDKQYVLVERREYERMVKALRRPREATAEARPGDAEAIPFAKASIARAIIRRRKAAGLSQKELAERSGVRPETLNRAERGVTVPDLRTLQKIEETLAAAGV